jgi:hypothetical protein
MKLRFAVLAVAACGSSAKPSDDCGARVTFVRAEDDRVVLRFDNVSNETIAIANSSEAAFVDVDGNAMSPERLGGFMSFKLPTGSHREVSVALTGGGDVERLDRLEVPHSGPGEIPMCTIRASGLAKGRPLPDKRDRAGETMTKMREFKDAMCKCANKACADKVAAEMTTWSQEIARHPQREGHMTEADTRIMQALVEELSKCTTKAMTADMGTGMSGDQSSEQPKLPF